MARAYYEVFSRSVPGYDAIGERTLVVVGHSDCAFSGVHSNRKTERRTLVLDSGLDRLQAHLLEMIPGEELSIDRASEISGLDRQTCSAVLDALTNAGLMMRLQHEAYVRRQAEADPGNT